MNEPSKIIIDLSRRLNELGFEKEPEAGDWYILNGRPILCAYANGDWHKWAEEKEDVELFLAPDLNQAVEWLRSRGQGFLPALFEPENHTAALEAIIHAYEKAEGL